MQNMTTGTPLKLIIKFFIPLLIGNIFQQLYSISDIVIVGKLIGVKALAALGVSAPLFYIMVVVSIGFTNGLTVITAQKFGAKDYQSMRRSVTTSVVLSTAFTLLISLTLMTFLDPIFRLMNVPADVYKDAEDFITIIGNGVILMIYFNLLSGFMRALGDSRSPLYFLIFTTVLNVLLNILFIYHFQMGVKGSALGTIAAMACSVVMCLFYINKKMPILLPQAADWRLSRSFCRQHLAIAIPMALQFSIIAVGTTIIQSVCNSFGADTIAAFTSALRVEQISVQIMISFGVAMSTYVAQNYGAHRIGRIRRGVFECSMVSLVVSIALAFIMHAYSRNVLTIFIPRDHTNIIDMGEQYLVLSTLFYAFLGQIFIFRNACQGMGNAVFPLISSFVELVIRAIAAAFLATRFGYIGICWASPIAWIGGVSVVAFGYYYLIRRLQKRHYFRHISNPAAGL